MCVCVCVCVCVCAELGSCVNREGGLGPHSLSHSSPVPNKPYGFCGRKAPQKIMRVRVRARARRGGGGGGKNFR